jgi:hypothetical protein
MKIEKFEKIICFDWPVHNLQVMKSGSPLTKTGNRGSCGVGLWGWVSNDVQQSNAENLCSLDSEQ